jgi:hypothetical protein
MLAGQVIIVEITVVIAHPRSDGTAALPWQGSLTACFLFHGLLQQSTSHILFHSHHLCLQGDENIKPKKLQQTTYNETNNITATKNKETNHETSWPLPPFPIAEEAETTS